MKIRFAEIKDLKIIIEIYNQAIKAGNATADLEEIIYTEREGWFLEHDKDSYPIYVMEFQNKIIGWGSLIPYRNGRAALKDTAEISYYFDYNFQGRGFGKKLISYMITDCKRIGIHNLLAFLLEINEKSISILDGYGFVRWGYMPDIVNLNGVKCAHVIYGKIINENIGI